MSKKVFLAFGGRVNENLPKKTKVAVSFEIWNLAKFDRDELYAEFRHEVFILDHILKKPNADLFPIFEHERFVPRWGMLIEESLLGTLDIPEVLALIDLYSDEFLLPIFKVDYLGGESLLSWGKNWYGEGQYWGQDRSELFMDGKFISFCDLIRGQHAYLVNNVEYFEKWFKAKSDAKKHNHFRIYLAHEIFYTLRRYQNSKQMVLYLQEAADIVTPMETLLIRKGETSLDQKLSERIELLLSSRYSNIKDEIIALYDKRSTFVHGDYYKILSKHDFDSNIGINFPLPEFELLGYATNVLRDLLIVYLFLSKKIDEGSYGKAPSVFSLITSSSSDPKLVESLKKDSMAILQTISRAVRASS